MKLNIDGAMSHLSATTGCGGVLRDCSGSWIVGFCRSLGYCSASSAEEWAVVKGLQLAWNLGCRRLIVESDAKKLIDLLLKDNMASSANESWHRW